MLNDQELVSTISGGNLHAFGVLVRQYEKLVFNVVRRTIRDPSDVEDVCQEVFIRVYRGLSGFTFQSKLSTWIARIAHRTALNEVKKGRRQHSSRPLEESVSLAAPGDTPGERVEKKDLSMYLNQQIEGLPPQHGLLVTLYHIHDFSYSEIEEITGMPLGTIKGTLFRARKMLKEKLYERINR